nr:Chain C, FIBRINOGEN [Homo sapiens]
LGGAKQRGDV